VPEEKAASFSYYVGPTKGGVTLHYAARVHEIIDYFGSRVRTLRYGESIRLEGELSRLYPTALARALGARRTAEGIELGCTGDAGRAAQVRAVLVCRLPDEAGGGEMRFSFLAGASAGAALTLSPQRDTGVRFTLTAETDGAGLTGRMVLI
jgi:hypothetical protein